MKIVAYGKEVSKTCCFTGMRPQKLSFGFDESAPDCQKIKEALEREIQNLITKKQVTHFITGMALGVDQWAAEAVLSLQERFPQITLECALPCETQAETWTVKQRERYFGIIERCSKETLLQNHYTKDCMFKRNRYMVDNSQFVVAVWDGALGGTAYTVKYAREKERVVRTIDPSDL